MSTKIGKHTYGVNNIVIKNWGQDFNLEIGAFCSIAGNVSLYLGGNHNVNWITTYPFGHVYKDVFNKHSGVGHPKPSEGIIIGNDVWLGADSNIMNGVVIGDGSIVAANSHVVKNIEPYSIVGGNPAKHICYRFDDEIIKKLLKVKWWNFSDEIINHLSPLLCSENFEEFFREAEKIIK